ncbi:MAG: ankyrin repeat domain-containing protein [Parachlamydiaceae bacterium]|nr:ankyrin repeat domain-containing protein [Parachlamydiaceae bacterium]
MSSLAVSAASLPVVVPGDKPTPLNLTLQQRAKFGVVVGISLLLVSPLLGVMFKATLIVGLGITIISLLYLKALRGIDKFSCLYDQTALQYDIFQERGVSHYSNLFYFGANPNATFKEAGKVKPSALHWAVSLGRSINNPSVVPYLLKAGADVNALNDEGETALFGALYSGDVEAVRLLLAHGVDKTIKNRYMGQTAAQKLSAERGPLISMPFYASTEKLQENRIKAVLLVDRHGRQSA